MAAAQEANLDLGVCPCGDQATWYRVAAPPVAAAANRSALSSIGLDDVTENLCDGCYKGFTGSLDEAVPGWKRADVLKRQDSAGEEDQSSQSWSDGEQGVDDW
ncbi:MAG: hypothetical protein H7Z41_08955 [Cytophagales bacterium]|nr:hypothetical protein [Armatimonadota bacterium]